MKVDYSYKGRGDYAELKYERNPQGLVVVRITDAWHTVTCTLGEHDEIDLLKFLLGTGGK